MCPADRNGQMTRSLRFSSIEKSSAGIKFYQLRETLAKNIGKIIINIGKIHKNTCEKSVPSTSPEKSSPHLRPGSVTNLKTANHRTVCTASTPRSTRCFRMLPSSKTVGFFLSAKPMVFVGFLCQTSKTHGVDQKNSNNSAHPLAELRFWVSWRAMVTTKMSPCPTKDGPM